MVGEISTLVKKACNNDVVIGAHFFKDSIGKTNVEHPFANSALVDIRNLAL